MSPREYGLSSSGAPDAGVHPRGEGDASILGSPSSRASDAATPGPFDQVDASGETDSSVENSGGTDANSTPVIDSSQSLADASASSSKPPEREFDASCSSAEKLCLASGRLWQYGTDGVEFAKAIVVSDGEVVIAGSTTGALGESALGGYDTFVQKFDRNGAIAWTEQFGSRVDDLGQGAAIDSQGNVYVAGYTYGSLGAESKGEEDAFLRKYDAGGQVVWTIQFGTDQSDVANAVTLDADGQVYVAGYSSGPFAGSDPPGSAAFVVSLDSDGQQRWSVQFETDNVSFHEAYSVGVDNRGSVYVGGNAYGQALQGDADVPEGAFYGFLRKLDAESGEVSWTRQIVGANGVWLSVSLAGDIYTSGGAEHLDGANSPNGDVYLRKFDSAGEVVWTQQFGTTYGDYAANMTCDAEGNTYVVGSTMGDLDGVNAGAEDAFLRKFDSSGAVRWTQQLGSNVGDGFSAVWPDSSGGVYAVGYTYGAVATSSASQLGDILLMHARPD